MGQASRWHQLRTSAATTTRADSITPNNASFVATNSDWTTADSDGTLRSVFWSSFDGSGICPIDYRVPTIDELEAELDSWSSRNSAGAFASSLNLPLAYDRSVSVVTRLWSATESAYPQSEYLYIGEENASIFSQPRGVASSVRCILNAGSAPVIEPLTIDAQTREVAENAANDTAVGVPLITTGEPTGFSITEGDSTTFTIDNSGQITIADNSTLDYEDTTSYALTVQISKDGTAAVTAQVTINITDVPFSIIGTNSTIAENTIFTSTSPTLAGDDRVGTITYTLTGADASLFTINTATGIVTSTAIFDFEAPASVASSNVYPATRRISPSFTIIRGVFGRLVAVYRVVDFFCQSASSDGNFGFIFNFICAV